jgi:hypothetical protein
MLSMQCNVEFGYQLSICSGIEENDGKPWSNCPVGGPSGCKLTSSQQSGIKDANPNISPRHRDSSLTLLKTSRHGPRRKHRFSVSVKLLQSCPLAEPFPSNGCCIVSYFAVHVPQYYHLEMEELSGQNFRSSQMTVALIGREHNV